ncbi:MAG: DUF2461 domain-containing protein [Acidimicrobiia bacterium]
MAFTGFPPEALDFWEGLEADNSKTYWTANRDLYESSSRVPMLALTEALSDFGEFKVFRPHRDVRFSTDKRPYKTHIGAVTETEGGTVYYVHLAAQGLFVAAGYHMMASDQVERFRQAAADEAGAELDGVLAAAEKARYEIGGSALKTVPRGYPKDHPRVRWLRHKGMTMSRQFPVARWLHTKAAVGRVRGAWDDAADLSKWLDRHVGPTTLPPERRRGG